MVNILTGLAYILMSILLFFVSTIDYEAKDESVNIESWNRKRQLCYRVIASGLAGLGIFHAVHQDSLYSQVMILVFSFMMIAGTLTNLYNNLNHFHTLAVSSKVKRRDK